MDNWKRKVAKQFHKIKSATTEFISDHDGDADEGADIELEPGNYKLLKQLSAYEQTSITTLVNRAIAHYVSTLGNSGEYLQIPDERKARNPLLYLDGITGIPSIPEDRSAIEADDDQRDGGQESV